MQRPTVSILNETQRDDIFPGTASAKLGTEIFFEQRNAQTDLAWAGAHNPIFNNEKTQKGTKNF